MASMPNDPVLRAQGLALSYGPLAAVAGIGFELARGQILGLLGPNGAGKSSTMQMLCGVLRPDRGTVTVCGIDLQRAPRRAKAHIGYLPEVPPLHGTATVGEYLQYCARLHGLRGAAAAGATSRVLERCGLTQVAARMIRNLSRGYQQRVGIAQAIVHAPDVVVLDEPTVGLDPNQVLEMRALIRDLGQAHAVIVSTHILPEVTQTCQRVIIMRQGRVVHDAPLAADDAHAFELSLREDVPAGKLAALPGVLQAVALGGRQYRVELAAAEPAGLAAAIVAAGLGLTGLRPVGSDLERLFVALTCSDAPPGGPA
jgi:ABC-2 type transport system ATP-binding protein